MSKKQCVYLNLKITYCWGFPGGAVVESLPANAGDAGSSPGLGGSHMPRSDWARGPQLLGLRVWSLCSAAGRGGPRQWEACAPRWRVAPARRNRGKPSHRNGEPTQPKINKKKNKTKNLLLRNANHHLSLQRVVVVTSKITDHR